MARNRGNGLDWMGLPMIAVVARLLCRELTLENEYLRLENRILKEKAQGNGRLRFTDEERRALTEAALAMGRSLMKEVVSIVKPETILAWQRRAPLTAQRLAVARQQFLGGLLNSYYRRVA